MTKTKTGSSDKNIDKQMADKEKKGSTEKQRSFKKKCWNVWPFICKTEEGERVIHYLNHFISTQNLTPNDS